jgi:hypothetical protein
MNLDSLISALKTQPESVEFADVISVIDTNYLYTPSDFTNGLGEEKAVNKAGTNEGSCKILAFAQDQGLSVEQTLHCFGQYYREDVLKNPEGSDHANIRNFIKSGWEGLSFSQAPLVKR